VALSTLSTRLEIMLERFWHHDRLQVTGVRGTLPLALLLTQISTSKLKSQPHLVITSSEEVAEKLYNDLLFFDAEAALYTTLLPGFEVSPLSGLTSSRRLVTGRLAWLEKASRAEGGQIFIAPIPHLLQKTLPLDIYSQYCVQVSRNFEVTSAFLQKLHQMGYRSSALVEDMGTYSQRGNIFDIFSPAHALPLRMELFGDYVDSIKTFDPQTQRSLDGVETVSIVPASEVTLDDASRERFLKCLATAETSNEIEQWRHSILADQHFQGIENLLPLFYEKTVSPFQYFKQEPNLWLLDKVELEKSIDVAHAELRQDLLEHRWAQDSLSLESYYATSEEVFSSTHKTITLDPIPLSTEGEEDVVEYSTRKVVLPPLGTTRFSAAKELLSNFKTDGFSIFISSQSVTQAQRLSKQLEAMGFEAQIVEEGPYDWSNWVSRQMEAPNLVYLLAQSFSESIVLPEERLVFLKEREILEKTRKPSRKSELSSFEEVKAITFGDLKPGEPIVHVQHGVGIYEGLKVLAVDGAKTEYLQIRYRDADKLYVPVYKLSLVHKFSAPFNPHLVDKLGGTSWEKAKIKVKHHLREVAGDLLKLYATRAQIERKPYEIPENDFAIFENEFPYQETDDQLKATEEIIKDFTGTRPMDRLICGDVGFGKTEVAMRAAFLSVQNGRQVAILVPTTTLAFQHDENFRNRFKKWPVRVASYSRFTSAKEAKEVIAKTKSGEIDILIGTHRLFSKDIEFKNLGLLIVDEEQRFGVIHKEKIRRMKTHVDTLTLSATPIPRTLNMSFMGVRDLSLINTPPQDRLPVRTYVMKFNKEVIKKAVEAELTRGGQVLFVHNRVQSIYQVENELKELLPKTRIRVGHGQMNEDELEETILGFFHHEFDLLLCTTIIESGMDIPRTNTILIDRSDTFGLSQLYQLRGRVGRGTERAYCYLFVPPHGVDSEAQERLKVLQENTSLGSGLRIAQYDLELRGAGDILGESQSGHANAVGYDLYMELLQEALGEAKGDIKTSPACEPEVNLKIPTFIPDSYMPDIRLRLAFYKMLSDAKISADIDRIEADLRDRFGPVPDEVLNLMGTVLIRNLCKEIGIKDVSAGPKNIILSFSESTKINPEKIIRLVTTQSNKFKIQPNNRLLLRLEKRDWATIFQELIALN